MYHKVEINCCYIRALVAGEKGHTRKAYGNFLATPLLAH